jgi:hypothetical protein
MKLANFSGRTLKFSVRDFEAENHDFRRSHRAYTKTQKPIALFSQMSSNLSQWTQAAAGKMPDHPPAAGEGMLIARCERVLV